MPDVSLGEQGIMKPILLIAFVTTCTLLSGCIIAAPYHGGPGREGRGGYGHLHGDHRDDDGGRYGNDHGRDHDDGRDRDRDRERDYRRD
ncbi:MAG: hypothetical protein EKK49_19230 [Rhodocyclaceae bacterium]|nr:MAG: hypothetical protein EKK49_19230 [Rhodocyclaceae bacterium]